ncbi:MAG: hypothetical protein Q7J29_12590 [Stagnimonas sp.]|nr:hypothetical protein [Stagnimonas sp.]
MALHPELPKSPYDPLVPDQRWFPAAEELRKSAYEKLLPPLVAQIRQGVFDWRAAGYAGGSATTVTLLRWWFETEHLLDQADGNAAPFSYYFAQREAVETILWLHDVKAVRDKYDLMRFDARGETKANLEDAQLLRKIIWLSASSSTMSRSMAISATTSPTSSSKQLQGRSTSSKPKAALNSTCPTR